MSEKSARKDLQAIDSGADFIQPVSGWVIGSRGGGIMRLETDKHLISMAGTGGGKGTSVAIPNLLTHEGSVFSIEIGGDTYRNTFNYRKIVMRQHIRIIDPFGVTGAKSDSVNLLSELRSVPPIMLPDHVLTFCQCIFEDPNTRETGKDSKFYENVAQDITVAHLLYMLTSPGFEGEKLSLSHLKKLLTYFGTGHAEYDLAKKMEVDKGPYEGYYETALSHLCKGELTGNDTAHNTRVTISRAFGFVNNPIVGLTADSATFELSELKKEKSTLYVVMPDVATYNSNSVWLRLLLNRAFAAFPNTGNSGMDLKHSDRALFLLDEFTQLGSIPSLEKGFSTLRQYGITLWPMFQTLSQLEKVYGKEVAGNMLGNAAVVQCFENADERTTQYVSNRLGKNFVYVRQEQHGESRGTSSQTNKSQANTQGTNRTDTDGVSDSLGNTSSGSFSSGTTETVSYGPQGQPSSTSDSSSSSFGESTTRTTGTHKSTAHGTSEQKTYTFGLSEGFNENRSFSITFTPQLVPKLDPSQVEEVVGTGNRQIIFINTEGRVLRLIDERAKYFQIPFLKHRAHGPAPLEIPEFGVRPDVPLKLNYQPAAIFGTTLDFSRLRTQQPDVVLEPVNPLEQKVKIKGVSWFNTPLKKAWNELSPGRDKKGRVTDSKEQLDLKRSMFIAAAPIITAASDSVRAEVRDKRESANNEWGRIDGSARELGKSYSRLGDVKEKLEKKKRTLESFEGILIEYRDDLIGLRDHVDANPDRINRHQRYIDAIVFLREQWVHNQKEAIAAPVRPQQKPVNNLVGAATNENITKAIGGEMQCRDFGIPRVPDLPKRPERSEAPVVSVAAPDKTLANVTHKLPDGTEYSLARIEQNIAYRSKWRFLLTRTNWQDNLKVKHFKQARGELIDKVFDHTGEVLRGTVASQQAYGAWLAADMAKAGGYAHDIRRTADKYSAVLDDMKSLEVGMDQHWEYLEGRLAGLNMAGQLLEQRSIRSFNRLAVAPEWQRLEWQSQRLLEAPKPQHGIHLASMSAEKPVTDGSPEAGKGVIIPPAPPPATPLARASRTTRSFQTQAADTTRRDEMSEDVVTKINSEGKVPDAADVAKLEVAIGHKLPQNYLDTLADTKAGVPLYNSFPLIKGETVTGLGVEHIERFYPFSKLDQFYRNYQNDYPEEEGLPAPTCNGSSDISSFLPIAKTHNAHLCLDVSQQRGTYGAVYCWQVSYDFGLNQFVKVADTFPAFLKNVSDASLTEEEEAKMTVISVSGDSTEDILARARARREQSLKK